jgi:hypothetical protein
MQRLFLTTVDWYDFYQLNPPPTYVAPDPHSQRRAQCFTLEIPDDLAARFERCLDEMYGIQEELGTLYDAATERFRSPYVDTP